MILGAQMAKTFPRLIRSRWVIAFLTFNLPFEDMNEGRPVRRVGLALAPRCERDLGNAHIGPGRSHRTVQQHFR